MKQKSPAGVEPCVALPVAVPPIRRRFARRTVERLQRPIGFATALVVGVASHGFGCAGGTSLGPPDSYLVFEPEAATPTAPGGGAVGDGAAVVGGVITRRVYRQVPFDDPRVLPVHRLALEGFLGEILRTDYLAKQLIRDGHGGQVFSRSASASANQPTVLVLSGSRTTLASNAAFGFGFETSGTFGRRTPHPDAMWIEIGDNPLSDPAFVQTATGRIAQLVAERLTRARAGGSARARALVEGYSLAMEVIAREWRVGEGPAGTLPPDAGTGNQRSRFAAVRQNSYVFLPDVTGANDAHQLRPGDEMVTEPGVVAATIYRMAQLKGIGRRVAGKEIYASFASTRIPEGVSPAAVLGPVRNFQAKLLTAWGRAILQDAPPRDLVDLVVAYARALPDERNEVFRVFVATTFGATVKRGGVSARPEDAAHATAELTALGAEVASGRKSPRAALSGDGDGDAVAPSRSLSPSPDPN